MIEIPESKGYKIRYTGKANDDWVKILIDEDVKKLLSKMERAFIGDSIAY